MGTNIPLGYEDTVATMRQAQTEIISALNGAGITIQEYPSALVPAKSSGIAAAVAYPIQGILKYHGLSDWDWRVSFMPSISVNNDSAHTLTLVEFDPGLTRDQVVIGGQHAEGRDYERVVRSLEVIRSVAGVSSRARVISKNILRAAKTGKGLGTSAGASAALAAAALTALLGETGIENTRFLSCMARLLAGSGCRSATGGVSLWLSYPGAAHEDSFSVRLDLRDQLQDIRLLTVPIDSRTGLKTETAHRDAPHSAFFKAWMQSRKAEVLECLEAVQAGDWRVLGQLAELDSLRLHGVTMSGSRENKVFAWEPENIPLFRMCNHLRQQGIPVYFSTDTGPTTVFITHREYAATVLEEIKRQELGLEVVEGKLAGPVRLVGLDHAKEVLGM